MNIKMIDALNLFEDGGYFDCLSGNYFMSPQRSQMIINLVDRLRGSKKETARINAIYDSYGKIANTLEYDRMRLMPDRYLSAPIIRSTTVGYISAVSLGISPQVLEDLGFNQIEHQKYFYDAIDTLKIRTNGYPQQDVIILEKLDDYTEKCKIYHDYVKKNLEIRHDIIKDWLEKHGIYLTDHSD